MFKNYARRQFIVCRNFFSLQYLFVLVVACAVIWIHLGRFPVDRFIVPSKLSFFCYGSGAVPRSLMVKAVAIPSLKRYRRSPSLPAILSSVMDPLGDPMQQQMSLWIWQRSIRSMLRRSN